ncbi:hypothetical protein ACFV3D_07110, partial [Streptomyces sp. NPDC059708]
PGPPRAPGVARCPGGAPPPPPAPRGRRGPPPAPAVLEYERLTSLLGDYGHTMPAESRKRLEEEVAALEPEWRAFREHGGRVTVRVRLDNGLVLDEVDEDVLSPA